MLHRWRSGQSSVRKWTQTAWHTLQSSSSSPVDRLSGRATLSSCTALWPGGPNPGPPGKDFSPVPASSESQEPRKCWWEQTAASASQRSFRPKLPSSVKSYFPQSKNRSARARPLRLQTLEDNGTNKPTVFLCCLQGTKTTCSLTPRPAPRSTQQRATITCTPWRSRSRWSFSSRRTASVGINEIYPKRTLLQTERLMLEIRSKLSSKCNCDASDS